MSRSILWILCLLASAGQAASPRSSEPVIWREWVLALDAKGAIRAWDAESLQQDRAQGKRLSSRPASALAAERDALYSTDGKAVTQWSAERSSWAPLASVPAEAEGLVRLLASARGPVVLFANGVFDV